MKKIISRFSTITLIMVIAASLAFPCSALRYYTYAVEESFASQGAFLAPGDVDGDGTLAASDLTQLSQVLLGIEVSDCVYTDVNGDTAINIIDLIRAKKNAAVDFVSEGAMNLNGKSTYSAEFASRMSPGASYQVICRYKSNSAVSVKLNGIGSAKDYTLASTSGSYTTVTNNFTTPQTMSGSGTVTLEINGTATVDSFEIKRVNADNEYNIGG